MQFAESNLTWLLLLVPLVILLRYYSYRGKLKELSELACPEVVLKIFAGFNNYGRYSLLQGIIVSAFALLLVIAALRPQYGFVWQESKRKGVDIVVAIDVSTSMLAEDVKPNRLQRAKREIYDLLEALKGDRVSLVAFSGVAFTEAPLTEDYTTFRLFLSLLDTSLIPVAGTNVGAAIDKSIEAFGPLELVQKSPRSRAIVLITDGEDLEGDYQEKAQRAKSLGIRIFIMGVGTKEGAPINTSAGYKKDKNGAIVISKLNEPMLQQLAQDTGGIYVQSITSEADTDLLYKMGIKKQLEDKTQQSARAKRWNEYYQIPLFIAVIFMLWQPLEQLFAIIYQYLMAVLIRNNKSSIILIYIISSIFFSAPTWAENKEKLGKEAYNEYQKGDFNSARNSFASGIQEFSDDYRFYIGSGATNYRLGNYKLAEQHFREAVAKTKEISEQAKALYDAGNSLVQLNQLENAIKAYEDSLKLVPNDKNTIENMAYAKRLLEQQKQQEQENKDQNDKQENQDQNKDQNQQQKQDKEQQQKQDQENSKENQSDSEQEKQNQQQEEQKSKQQSNQQQNTQQQEKEPSNGSQNTDNGSDKKDSFDHRNEGQEVSAQQAETLLEGIQENRSNLLNYRKQEALEEMRKIGKTKVEKDW